MAALRRLVEEHDDLALVDGKINVTSTGHEFGTMQKLEDNPEAAMKLIQTYLSGNKYKMAREAYSKSFDHYPHISVHKKHPKKLFCLLCGFHLNRIPKQIEDHISGRRHQCRLRESENGNQGEQSIPDQLASLLESDEEDQEDNELSDGHADVEDPEEEEAAAIPEDDGIPFEEVTMDEEMEASVGQTKYDSSSEEEMTNEQYMDSIGKKRVVPKISSSAQPRRKKNKRGKKQ
jgi:hypothetical protein